MKQSESITEIAKALVVVHGHISPIVKDRTNPHFKNNYATLDAIMETVRPLLAGHGLAIIQGGGGPVSNVEGAITGVSVETLLVHTSGQFFSSVIVLPISKATPQEVGSAITYGRRYGVAAVLSLTTEEDDDGHQASTTRQPAKAAAAKPAAAGFTGDAAKKFPFGKLKGTELGALSNGDLEGAIEWCSSDDEKKEKFKDLIAACSNVVRARAA